MRMAFIGMDFHKLGEALSTTVLQLMLVLQKMPGTCFLRLELVCLRRLTASQKRALECVKPR